VSRKDENTSFICVNCGAKVAPLKRSYRNHCPNCLYSLHIDVTLGDRKCTCRGLMEPNRVVYSTKKGWQLIHVCAKCGARRLNRVADGEDNMEIILKLMKNAADGRR
jgi:DNA-directed RNA polymerase subunit RPC12/RpoP